MVGVEDCKGWCGYNLRVVCHLERLYMCKILGGGCCTHVIGWLKSNIWFYWVDFSLRPVHDTGMYELSLVLEDLYIVCTTCQSLSEKNTSLYANSAAPWVLAKTWLYNNSLPWLLLSRTSIQFNNNCQLFCWGVHHSYCTCLDAFASSEFWSNSLNKPTLNG